MIDHKLVQKAISRDGISPKKSLGQNFLVDKKALQKIVRAAEINPKDNILEIGPGTGVLTGELSQHAGRVIAIEKDEQLAEKIESRIMNQESWKNTKIIKEDILKVNLPELVEKNDFFGYKLVANIPYYITGKILRLFFETQYRPKLMVLLVQKEVAERVCAGPGAMSKLSVSVQLEGMPSIVAKVPKESFWPEPKVDSAILKILVDPEKKVPDDEKKQLFRIVKIGFSSPRKTLVNNLAAGLGLKKEDVGKILESMSLNPMVRPEALSIDQWRILSQKIE